MLKRLIGTHAFRAGMDLYFERWRTGYAATVEDFIGCFETVSGRDLSQFMRWYNQAGMPKVTVAEGLAMRGRQHLPARHCANACADLGRPSNRR